MALAEYSPPKVIEYQNGSIGLIYPEGRVHVFDVDLFFNYGELDLSMEEQFILMKMHKRQVTLVLINKEWKEYLKKKI